MDNGKAPHVKYRSPIKPKYLTQLLKNDRKREKRTYKLSKQKDNHRFILTLIIVTLVFLLLTFVLLQNNEDLLERVVTLIVGLVSGAIGGFNVGRMKRNSD